MAHSVSRWRRVDAGRKPQRVWSGTQPIQPDHIQAGEHECAASGSYAAEGFFSRHSRVESEIGTCYSDTLTKRIAKRSRILVTRLPPSDPYRPLKEASIVTGAQVLVAFLNSCRVDCPAVLPDTKMRPLASNAKPSIAAAVTGPW